VLETVMGIQIWISMFKGPPGPRSGSISQKYGSGSGSGSRSFPFLRKVPWADWNNACKI